MIMMMMMMMMMMMISGLHTLEHIVFFIICMCILIAQFAK